MFEVAIYTDSTPEESLSGSGGFQFQSASPGVAPSDQASIMSSGLIHVVDPVWIQRGDPLAHPPSCGYRAAGERYILARGRSTGDTFTGRPGNQLTQAILTSDIADFTPYRPAQLFGAEDWSLEKAGTKTLQPWATPLAVDKAYEAYALKDALLVDSWARESLSAFLTMIEESFASPQKKLVIVGKDLPLVMKWIALGTLFLDPATAITVTFAAMVKDWLSKNVNIVGTDPAFGDPPTIGHGTPYNVFDLARQDRTPLAPSASSVQHASWFLNLDPDDALAAISLARTWEPRLGASVATHAAEVAHLGGSGDPACDRDSALAAIAGLSRDGGDDDLTMYADELVAAAVAQPIDDHDQAALAAEASWGAIHNGIDDHGADLVLQTVQDLREKPELLVTWATASLAAECEPISQRAPVVQGKIDQALVMALNVAPAEGIADLLLLAGRERIQVPARAVAPALDRFAALCARNPGIAQSNEGRAYRDDALARTLDALLRLLAAQDESAIADLSAGRWDWVKTITRGPLDGWFAATEIGRREPSQRAEALRSTTTLPPDAWKLVLNGIVLPQDSAVVGAWIRATRVVTADFGDWLVDAVHTALRSPPLEAARLRRVAVALTPPPARIDSHEAERLVNAVNWLHNLTLQARQAVTSNQNRKLFEFAKDLNDFGPLFHREIGELLVESKDQRAVDELTRAYRDGAVSAMVQHYRRSLGGPEAARGFATAMYLHSEGNRAQRQAADDFLTEVADSRELRAQMENLLPDLDESWGATWDEFVAERKKGRMARNLKRGGKRFFGKDD